jgi:acetyl-CoA C-acetyltransferase
VLQQTLAQAGKSAGEMDLIDIYSCFPCAVTMVADYLGLPTDGTVPLSLTGGLPYFGGPGNNYAMHGVAEAVTQRRHRPDGYALVTAVGGMLSKHAAAVHSRVVSTIDWAEIDTTVECSGQTVCRIASEPASGQILTYVVNYQGASRHRQ